MNFNSSLSNVMFYENDKLVRLYCRTKNIPYDESLFLFQELKKFLWFLGQRNEDAPPFIILDSQRILDDYWHEFILYTKSYMDFCEKYFGRYIHHYPYDSHESIERFVDKNYKEEYKEDLLLRIRQAMTEVEENLGIDTVYLWYIELPKRYGGNN